MRLIDIGPIKATSRSDTFSLYPIGDTHIGARNCAEKLLRQHIRRIASEPNAYWLGMGDLCDCISMKDIRFSTDVLPDWLINDNPRRNMRNLIGRQLERAAIMFHPIKDKCLGLIEGNHEAAMRNRTAALDPQEYLCEALETEDLTSEAILRVRFTRQNGRDSRTFLIWVCHGHGGGRSKGSEPNHLGRLTEGFDGDIVLRGHSHTFCIPPARVMLTLPIKGKLPEEAEQKYTRAANTGCWLLTYKSGPSNYASQHTYPPRQLSAVKITFRPFLDAERHKQFTLEEVPY